MSQESISPTTAPGGWQNLGEAADPRPMGRGAGKVSSKGPGVRAADLKERAQGSRRLKRGFTERQHDRLKVYRGVVDANIMGTRVEDAERGGGKGLVS